MLLELDDTELEQLVEAYKERWTASDEVVASLFDLVGVLLNVTLRANSKKGSHVPEPPKYPRPGRSGRATMKPSDLAKALNG
ncbi:MAG: hypothetical protein AB7R77_12640 [Ilumatobacteraceae bacterium]